MPLSLDDARRAGKLLQWGLRAKARPMQEPEYKELIDLYFDQSDFRAVVREIARGLGVQVLDVGEHGLVLGPTDDSAFALRPSEFRSGSTVDDRLLDGLVQLAIAATVFPRSRDLDDEATIARPPVTVDEVDENLRIICDRLAAEAREHPDPSVDADETGLDEAWRVYSRRLSAARSTRRIVESNLERLRDYGSFVREQRGEDMHWQPTWRYQVLVKELAASVAYRRVRRALEEKG